LTEQSPKEIGKEQSLECRKEEESSSISYTRKAITQKAAHSNTPNKTIAIPYSTLYNVYNPLHKNCAGQGPKEQAESRKYVGGRKSQCPSIRTYTVKSLKSVCLRRVDP